MSEQATQLLSGLLALLGVPLSMTLLLCIALAGASAMDRTGT